jgi:HK97 family phage portal protein
MKGYLDQIFGSGRRVPPKNFSLSDLRTAMKATFTGVPSSTGIRINEHTALSIATVFSCVRLLSEAVAGLPLNVLRDLPGPTGAAIIDESHPVSILLKNPNPENTPGQLCEHIMVRMLMQGSAYVRKLLLRNGRIGELWPITGVVRPERNEQGELLFHVFDAGKPLSLSAPTEILDTDDVWRISGLSFNTVDGLTPIGLFRNMFGLAIATERHGANTFRNGARIQGVLQHPGVMEEEEQERFIDSWQSVYAGVENSGKTPILEQGMEYKGISMNLEDAQYLETRKFSVADVARIYRVPLHMVMEVEAQPRANMEQQAREFVTFSLSSWLDRISSTGERDLFLERDRVTHKLKHDTSKLTRADFEALWKGYSSALGRGVLSVNEVRAREDLPPVEGGDERVRPINLVPLGTETGGVATPPGSQPGTPESARTDRLNVEQHVRLARMVEDTARRIVAREVGKIRKWAKSDGTGTFEDLETWYATHATFVIDALHAPVDWAIAYCEGQLARLRLANAEGFQRVEACADHFERTTAARIAAEVMDYARS